MAVQLQDIMQGLQMLGGVMALPRSVQYQEQQANAMQNMLQGTGMSKSDIESVAPEPGLRWLSAGQPGFGHKILGGVGDVGALLSTIAGKPIGPPRMDISDIAAASKLRTSYAQSQAEQRMAQAIREGKSPNEIAAMGLESGLGDASMRYLGTSLRVGAGGGKMPTGEIGLRMALETMDPDDPKRPQYQRALDNYLNDPRRQGPVDPAEQEHKRNMQQIADKTTIANAHPEWTPEQRQAYIFGPATVSPGQHPRQPAAKTLLDFQNIARQNRIAVARARGVPPNFVGVEDEGQAMFNDYNNRLQQQPGNQPGAPDKSGGSGVGGQPPGTQKPADGPPKVAPQVAPNVPAAPRVSTPPPAAQSLVTPAPSGATSAAPTIRPEQTAAIAKLTALAQQQGVDPRGLRETNPDLWAQAGLTGTENLPAEQFYQLLADPAALAQWQAGQGQAAAAGDQTAAQGGQVPISDVTGKPLSPAGFAKWQAMRAELATATPERRAEIQILTGQLQ